MAPAQAQTDGPVLRVSATPDPTTTIGERFGSVTVGFNVTIENSNRNAVTDQFEVMVNVSRSKPDPVPNGWAISSISEEQFQLAPGETRRVTVTVTLTEESPPNDQVRLEFRVHGRPVYGGQPPSPLDPVTQQLVAAGSQESDANVQTTVKRDLEPAEALTSFVFQNAWILAVAAAAIIVVIVFLLRGRTKSGINVTTDSTHQEVVPGRGASFPLVITNVGGGKENIVLGTSDVPNGWSAILPVDRLELRGNESTTIWLTLKSPAGARPGERVQVAFVATAADGSATEARLEAVVVERYGEPLTKEPMEARTRPARA